jgi:hypothetical protein
VLLAFRVLIDILDPKTYKEHLMSDQRPNLLLITTDEHRFDCLGCYGNPVIRTPDLDSLAEQGVRFERCYVQNPMCMPFPNLGFGELHDLELDPHELENLFYHSAYADRVAEMRLRLLNRFMSNQRAFVGERTEAFGAFYDSDHRPPHDVPGTEYALPEPA